VGAATYGTFDMNEDILLLKVNSRGEVRWSRQTGSDLEDNIGSVVVDSEDNIYMAGYTKGTVNGEPNFGKTDAFLIKWNQEGEKLWAKQWGSDLYERANFVAVDKDDNLYVTGGTDGSMENYHNSSEGFFDIFISKFNSDGDMEWTKQWGTGPHDLADSIVVDSLNDKIYITGSTEGPLDGNMKLGSNDVFLTKLDLDGNKEWTRQWGSDDTDMGVSVKVSQSGKVFVLSNTDGDVFEENEDLLPSDQIALTKFTSDGDYEWTKLWGGGFNSFALDMVIDSDDKIFVTGSVAGEFEGFVNEKYPDAFITKWDTEGNIMWNEQWGNDYTNIGSGIAIDSIRNIYVTGRIEGPFSGVKENDWMDIFLAKFIQEN
jgi:hypothetical protein